MICTCGSYHHSNDCYANASQRAESKLTDAEARLEHYKEAILAIEEIVESMEYTPRYAFCAKTELEDVLRNLEKRVK